MENESTWTFCFEIVGHSDPELDLVLSESRPAFVIEANAECPTDAGDLAHEAAWRKAESMHGKGVDVREIPEY